MTALIHDRQLYLDSLTTSLLNLPTPCLQFIALCPCVLLSRCKTSLRSVFHCYCHIFLLSPLLCLSVALGTPDECHNGEHMVTLTSPTGYLSSLITEETGFGTSGCPWKIKAGSGQQVSLAVFDFNLLSFSGSHNDYYAQDEYSSWCPISIVVEDQDIRKDIPLCNGGQRESHIYTSTGNEVMVHFVIRKMPDIHYYFLVQYQGEILFICTITWTDLWGACAISPPSRHLYTVTILG